MIFLRRKSSSGGVGVNGSLMDRRQVAADPSYSLELEDQNVLLEVNSLDLVSSIIIPSDDEVEFSIGSQIFILQIGDNRIEIQGNPEVQLHGTSILNRKWSLVTLLKRSYNTWVGIGVDPDPPQVLLIDDSTYVLSLLDIERTVEFSESCVVTIPSFENFPVKEGSRIYLLNAGTGTLTVQGADGVVVDGSTSVDTQWASISLLNRDENMWVGL